jgi:DNA transposition AAA+ family ATPase
MATTETKKKTYDENLQREVKDLIDKKVLEQSTIARGINKSPATLSLYLKSNYEGKVDEIENDLKNYLRFLQRKENVELKSLNFVETTIVKNFLMRQICVK